MPVSPKMLRHFAAATVAITFCVAIFADGEGREAIAAQVEAREARTNLLEVEAGKLGTRRVGLHNLKLPKEGRAHIPFGQDVADGGGDYGAPMDSAAGNDAGSGWTQAAPGVGPNNDGQRAQANPRGPAGPDGSILGPPNLTNRAPRTRRPSRPPQPTEAQQAAVLAASRARSGRAESVE